MKRIRIIFSYILLISVFMFQFSSFKSKASGLEIPILIGGGVISTEIATDLIISLGVALAGGHALDEYAKKEGYGNSYDFMRDKYYSFCDSGDRVLEDVSQGIARGLSYTKDGYILIGDSAKDILAEFMRTFDNSITSGAEMIIGGKQFYYLEKGTELTRIRGYKDVLVNDCYAICTSTGSFGTYDYYLLPIDKNLVTQLYSQNKFLQSTTVYEDDSFKYYNYFGSDAPALHSSVYNVVSPLPTVISSWTTAFQDYICVYWNTTVSQPTAENIFEDSLPLVEPNTLPLVVNPDVLPNVVGQSAFTLTDYADLLQNYYSNIYKTNNYVIDNSSVINNYYTYENDNTDTYEPLVPSVPAENPNEEIYTYSIKDIFPFCIPFDIADIVKLLKAEPKAPIIEYDLGFSSLGIMDDSVITIDLSSWDSVAEILRISEDILFILGLAFFTRFLLRS